ncbi:hypothetical protein [Pradoshia sp.]
MKNTRVIMMICLLAAVLNGCSNTIETKSNLKEETTIVTVQDFSDREDTILNATSEISMIFDFKVDKKYKEIIVWMEKYQFGKFINNHSSYSHLDSIEESGTIVFAVPRGSEAFTSNIGISSNGQSSVISRTDKGQSENGQLQEMGKVWGSLDQTKTIQDNEDFLLGYIGYSSDDQSVSSASPSVFDNPEMEKEEIMDYDVAYLLKARFVQ